MYLNLYVPQLASAPGVAAYFRAAFGQGCRTGLESGAHPGAARRALERAHDGQRNRAEQIECAATLVGP